MGTGFSRADDHSLRIFSELPTLYRHRPAWRNVTLGDEHDIYLSMRGSCAHTPAFPASLREVDLNGHSTVKCAKSPGLAEKRPRYNQKARIHGPRVRFTLFRELFVCFTYSIRRNEMLSASHVRVGIPSGLAHIQRASVRLFSRRPLAAVGSLETVVSPACGQHSCYS